jgi:hypothetical protein
MALRNRIERLENASASNVKIASITYAEGEQTKAEAIAEWEAENGSLSEYEHVFFTMLKRRPGTISAVASRSGNILKH